MRPPKEYQELLRSLTLEQVEKKVQGQREDLAKLNAEHAIAARVLKEKRLAALRGNQ